MDNIIMLYSYWLGGGNPPVLINKLLRFGFTKEQISMICKAIGSTCNACWDHDNNAGETSRGTFNPCYCMRDE